MLVIEQYWWDLMKKDENQHFNQCSHGITYKIKKINKIYYRPTDSNFFGNVSGNSTLIFFGLTILEFAGIKKFTVQNSLALLTGQFLRVVFSKASPDNDFLPKRLLASEIDKSIRIWLKFTTYHVSLCWCQHKYVPKIIKFHERLPQKTTHGDNWPAAITGRLPVDNKKSQPQNC